MRLAIGGAQFGLDYGIANKFGKMDAVAAQEIIALARISSIDTIDTAISYGNSEVALGNVGISNFKVVTKLPAIPDDVKDISVWIKDQLLSSLQRLNMQKVYGLLLHRPDQLLSTKGYEISQALSSLKDEGLVTKTGVSIYDSQQLGDITKVYKPDIVQAPFNLIDRRLVNSGWLTRLHQSGIEIHVRSAFLQGLLLMDKGTLPEKFKHWDSIWQTWYAWQESNSMSAVQACLQYVLSYAEIDRVIVGVDSIEQLRELITVSGSITASPFPEISSTDLDLINPSHWN